jgi:hypothetical protein
VRRTLFGSLVLLVLSACAFTPATTQLTATVQVPFQGIFGWWFTEGRSSITVRPGKNKTVDLALRFSQTSSGWVEPGSGIGVYGLSARPGFWSQAWDKQIAVVLPRSSITLNASTKAELRVSSDAKPGPHEIEFQAQKFGFGLGDSSASATLRVTVERQGSG